MSAISSNANPGRRWSGHRLLGCACGTAAVQFAIIGGVFSAVLMVASDLGLAWYSDMQVESAAQAGAEFAVVHGFNSVAIKNTVANASFINDLAANPEPVAFCGCPSGTRLSAAVCGTRCPDGAQAPSYARISASRTHSTVVPYPWMPPAYTQTATATVRIK